MAPHAGATAGCGATNGGTSQYDQSTCGNVAPYPRAAAGTAISSCRSLGPGTYHLTQNLGGAAANTCITFTGGPVKFDFAGFQITGRLVANDIRASGTHIYSSAPGGRVTCSDHSAPFPGCLFIAAYDAVSAALEIDHLTFANTDSSSVNSARNLYVDWSTPTSRIGTAFGVKIHHITSTSATGLTSSRIPNIHLNFSYNAEFNNNDTTCRAAAAACQGIVAYGPNASVHNNRFVSELLNPANVETARAVVCDSTKGCQIYNNYFDAGDSRAIRLRGVTNRLGAVDVHDNLIDNVTHGLTPNYSAAIHVCDPDSGENDGSSYVFRGNTIYNKDGVVLMSRGCKGYPRFTTNKIACIAPCSGTLAAIRTPLGGSSSTFELTDNSPVPFTSEPQSSVTIGASAQICNTGTVGGAGTIKMVCAKSPVAGPRVPGTP